MRPLSAGWEGMQVRGGRDGVKVKKGKHRLTPSPLKSFSLPPSSSAAMPHTTVNPVIAAATIISQLKSTVTATVAPDEPVIVNVRKRVGMCVWKGGGVERQAWGGREGEGSKRVPGLQGPWVSVEGRSWIGEWLAPRALPESASGPCQAGRPFQQG